MSATGRDGGFGPLRALDDLAPGHNLPSQTSTFVGRVVEMAELHSLMAGASRLITIVGAGGIGKSRLAVRLAAQRLDVSADGVWLAELAPVADPELVAPSVAAVLGIREQPGRPMLETLVDVVGERDVLVVIDNAEHVLDAVAKLAGAMLRSCPQASLLVTSREPLGVDGEQIFRLPPLSVPPAAVVSPDQVAAFESAQLFVARASQRRPSFALDETNAEAVASVCARLDGIPLAIELAAARLGSLSVSEIYARLDQQLRLLTGGSRTALPRHQTLRALIDWSYELLKPVEQVVLDRLSVFAGGWTLEAAEAVAAGGDLGEGEVFDHIAALVDKSLVEADQNRGSTRYRLLDTIRHYAAERLRRRPGSELQVAGRTHRDHYLAMVETAAAHLRGDTQALWLDRLEVEIDNVRAALSLSVADPTSPEPGLRLATALRHFCMMRGQGRDVLDALGALLERPDAHGRSRTRARALNATCYLLDRFGDDSPLASAADEAVSIAREVGDDALIADALTQRSWISYAHDDLLAAIAQSDGAIGLARRAGDPHLMADVLTCRAVFETAREEWSAAFDYLEEVLGLVRAAGDNFGLALTLVNIGVVKLALGESQAARIHLEEADTLVRRLGYHNLLTALHENLGLVDIIDADPGPAREHFVASLAAAGRTGITSSVPGAFLGLALAARADGDHTVAAVLHGVADEQYEQAGRPFEALEAALRDRDHVYLRITLDAVTFDRNYRRGRSLSQQDAVALATATAHPDPDDQPMVVVASGGTTMTEPTGLSAREREIIALVAGGATDAQIAKRLFLSVNTVRSHLERIRDKTGARRRAELARYAIHAGIEAVAISS